MAKVVPDEDAWGPKTPRGKVMDWRRYCDGQSWRLERGVDVDPEKSMHSKRSSFRQWAARQGLNMDLVHTSVVDDRFLLIKVEREAWPEEFTEFVRPEVADEREREARELAQAERGNWRQVPKRVRDLNLATHGRERADEIRERDT